MRNKKVIKLVNCLLHFTCTLQWQVENNADSRTLREPESNADLRYTHCVLFSCKLLYRAHWEKEPNLLTFVKKQPALVNIKKKNIQLSM